MNTFSFYTFRLSLTEYDKTLKVNLQINLSLKSFAANFTKILRRKPEKNQKNAPAKKEKESTFVRFNSRLLWSPALVLYAGEREVLDSDQSVWQY